MTTIKAVILDHSTLAPYDPATTAAIQNLLVGLQQRGLAIVIFSTHTYNMERTFKDCSYPAFDLYLTSEDVQAKKGAPAWIQAVVDRLDIERHELLYVGDDKLDWVTALNSAVFYLHATWSKPLTDEITAIQCQRPEHVLAFLHEFLLHPPRWEYTLDIPRDRLRLRTLLDRSVVLPATSRTTFELTDVFTRKSSIRIGNQSARSILMEHAISSLYLEGLILPGTFFVIYPGSKCGTVNEVMSEFITPMAKTFRGFYKDDVLIRHRDAADTSLARYRGQRISETEQMDSVCINDIYSTTSRNSHNLRKRSVIVFDDFTTHGTSLDWARNLLTHAHAGDITLVSIGRYGNIHTVLRPRSPAVIRPFTMHQYAYSDFTEHAFTPTRNAQVPELIKLLFGVRVERSR